MMSDMSQTQTTLAELIERLDSLDVELTIYAEKNPDWSPHSNAVAWLEDDSDPIVDADGLSYLLEVELAKEVIEVWSAWRDERQPTIEEKCEAIIFYAEHDAYLPES